jgi:oxaloacetate decarboxylase alpha subunit
MTGVIDQVLVQEGASVAEGDTIIVLEAMKMYSDVMASASGTVSGISVKPGDSVKEGQQLLSIGTGGAG